MGGAGNPAGGPAGGPAGSSAASQQKGLTPLQVTVQAMVKSEVAQTMGSAATASAPQDLDEEDEGANRMKAMQTEHQKQIEKIKAEAAETAKKHEETMKEQRESFAKEAAERRAEADKAMKDQMNEFKAMMQKTEESLAKNFAEKKQRIGGARTTEDALANPKGRSRPAAGYARDYSKRYAAFCSRYCKEMHTRTQSTPKKHGSRSSRRTGTRE